MDIQSASVNMSQAQLQEQAAVQVQSMAMDTVKEQSAALDKLLQSVQVVADPNMGQNVDATA
jgi:hypothetical protein